MVLDPEPRLFYFISYFIYLMSNLLSKARVIATFMFAFALVAAPFVGTVGAQNLDAPELSLGDIVGDDITNDPDGITFSFESDQDGHILYVGECASDTIEIEADVSTEVTFTEVPDGEYDEGDCQVKVFNSEGDISDPLDVPTFTVDTVDPKLTVTEAVFSPFNITSGSQPQIKVYVDEDIDEITYGGSCDASNTSLNGNTDTTLTLRDASDEDPLDDGTYSDCTIQVQDEAGNSSNTVTVPEFTLIDEDNIFLNVGSIDDPSDSSLYDNLTKEVSVSVTYDGTIFADAASECTVSPNIVEAGSNDILLSLQNVDYTSGNDCILEYYVLTSDFDGEIELTEDISTDIGDLSGESTSVPDIDESEANLVEYDNENVVGFTFTVDQGGTWAIVDDTSASASSTCDLLTYDTDTSSSVNTELVNGIVVPGENTVLLELHDNAGAHVPLPDGDYGDSTEACLIQVFDSTGGVSDTLDMPEFSISDDEGPEVTILGVSSSPIASDSDVEIWFTSDEIIDSSFITLTNIDLDGDCFDSDENELWPTSPTLGTDLTIDSTNDSGLFATADILSVGYYNEYNRITIDNDAIEAGEYSGCQIRFQDAAGNNGNAVTIPTFSVGGAGPEFDEEPQFLSGTIDNPVSFTFEASESGTFAFDEADDCRVDGDFKDINMSNGDNTVILDNLPAGSVSCDITLFSDDGVQGETDTLDFTIDQDEDPSLRSVSNVNPSTLTFTFSSETNGFITYDGLCGSRTIRATAGDNTVKLNPLPVGLVVSDCEITVSNNDDTDTLNLSTFTVEASTTDPNAPVVEDGTVYRFFNMMNGAFLYTTSADEVAAVQQLTDEWSYEGPKFKVSQTQETGTTPVYRLFNTERGGHLYTISEVEYQNVKDTLPQYSDEGVVYYVYTETATGRNEIFRFFDTEVGIHLYTDNADERASVEQIAKFNFEGTPYFVEGLN